MKIYVDKMPKATGQGLENQEELEIRMIFDGNKTADIELIHDHDKELVEKMLEKVKSNICNDCTFEKCEKHHCELYKTIKIINKLKKDNENEIFKCI